MIQVERVGWIEVARANQTEQDLRAACVMNLVSELIERGFVKFETSQEVTLGDGTPEVPPEQRATAMLARIQVVKWD